MRAMSSPRRAVSRTRSFGHALEGLGYAWRTQPNVRIHVGILAVIVLVGLVLRIDLTAWALIVLAAGLVFAAELLNTGIETVVDLASPDLHPLAKAAKDVAAGAVLVAAMTAVGVGLLVLGPPLWAMIAQVFL